VITTSHSGASEVIQPGKNGNLFPLETRKPTDAVLKWWSEDTGRKSVAKHSTKPDIAKL